MSRAATTLRAYHRGKAYDAQRRYAAMSERDQRAYAAAHPAFVARFGNVVPEVVRWAMHDAPDDEAADAIWDAHVRSTTRAATQRALARARVTFGERVIYVILAAMLLTVLGAALGAVAYVAAGRHGAVVAATAAVVTWALYAVWRLASGSR